MSAAVNISQMNNGCFSSAIVLGTILNYFMTRETPLTNIRLILTVAHVVKVSRRGCVGLTRRNRPPGSVRKASNAQTNLLCGGFSEKPALKVSKKTWGLPPTVGFSFRCICKIMKH